MKLHVILDAIDRIKVSKDDIVVVSTTNHRNYKEDQLIIDENIINDSDYIYDEINNWFDTNIPTYASVKNKAYVKFFKPVFQTLYFLDHILSEYDVSEIILYGGSRFVFLTTVGGEGEGKKVHYKTNWLVNNFIEKKYKANYKIIWKNRKPNLFFVIYALFRNIRERVELFLRETKRCLQYKTSTCFVKNPSSNTIITISDLPLQYYHLTEIISILINNNNQICHYHFSFNRSVAKSNCDVIYIGGVSFRELISIIIKPLPSLFNKGNLAELSDFLSASVRLEFKYMYLELWFREKRLLRAMKTAGVTNKCKLLTDMTAGHVIAIRDAARKLGCYHYNIQHVSMSPILYPDLELANKFYLYSVQTFNLYQKYSNSYYFYFPIEEKSAIITDSKKTIVSVFCQPDAYTQDYLNYISIILPIIAKQEKEIQVIVKPHYRQDRMNEFLSLTEKYPFTILAQSGERCSDIISKSTVCMSISSSVIFEAMTMSKPCVIYNPEHKYDYDVYDSGVCYPDVNFVTTKAEETIEMLKNIPQLMNTYKDRFGSFIKKNKCITDWRSLLDL